MVKENVLITGASGFVGTHLTPLLIAKGYNVLHLNREVTGREPVETFKWDPLKGEIDSECVEKADYIIHLAGASIGDKKWSNSRKELIIESRVKSADLLFNKVQAHPNNLKAFISASGIGVYGTVTKEHIFSEEDAAAKDFTGFSCELWEKAADKFLTLGKRVVKLRTAVVLGKGGGALEVIAKPFRLYAGAELGSGKQYFPWIHINDLCALYIKAIEDEKMTGVYNAVAPQHVTNSQLTKAIAEVLDKPLFLPNVPAFALKLALGEMANLVLKGSRVSAQKILNTGYKFQYPELKPALEDTLR
jgi:uncharacterized protein